MLVGVPKEIKNHEYRVGLTPESVAEVVANGHKVIVETKAGDGIGASDEQYKTAGAEIVNSAAEIYKRADMVVKIKEPQVPERKMLRKDQILFSYLHLAPDPEQTRDLINSGAVCIAYETVTDDEGGVPLLKPASQVAGRMSIHAGATTLEKSHGGRGVLLGGAPGVAPANVLILGGGAAGFHAAQMAVGMQADVTILDRSQAVLEKLSNYFAGRAKVRHSSRSVIEELLPHADLVIGAVYVHGATAPKLVTRKMLGTMKKGAVLVDISIDQGGCFETSKPTTHDDPTFIVDGIVHYCVTNMPGAVARTSTYAINIATLRHVVAIANKGWKKAMKDDPHLRDGLNVWNGKVTYEAVAHDLGYDYLPAEKALAA